MDLRRLMLLLATFAALAPYNESNGQEAPELTGFAPGVERVVVPGDRVRITAPQEFSGVVEGKIGSLGPDVLILEPEESENLVVPLASLQTLEVSRGNQANLFAIVGVFGGALAGAALTWAIVPAESRNGTGVDYGHLLIGASGVLGSVGGHFVGKRVDRLAFGEKWEAVTVSRVRWESGLTATLGLTSERAVSLSLSLAF